MGLFSRLLGIQALSLEDPAQPLMPTSALFESLGLGRSDAGVLVNSKQALCLPEIYAAIKSISEDLSSVDLDIFQTMPDGSLRMAPEHRCYSILHDRPNINMSSQVWRIAMMMNVLLHGNAYSYIRRDKAARVIELIPLDAIRTSPCRVNGQLVYGTTQTPSGNVEYIDPANILHFKNVSLDGITGISPIDQCKNAIGIGIASEKYAASFFANGLRTSGVLTHPSHLDPESYENLRKSVHEIATGVNALRPLILEEGMDFKPIQLTNDEAQMIETMKLSKERISSIMRVPLHILNSLERSTNNNIEHQGREYVQYCLGPRARNIEEEINFKLLGGTYHVKHNFFQLQEGDFQAFTTGLLALRNGGVYSTNDVLRALRQNPISQDEGGDIRIVQGAFIPLDSLLLEDDKPAKPETEETDSDAGNPAALHRNTIVASYRPLFRDAVGRTINRAGDAEFVKKAFHPAINSLCQTVLASQYGTVELTQGDLDKIGSVVNTIIGEASTWTKTDAPTIATELTQRCYDALAAGTI